SDNFPLSEQHLKQLCAFIGVSSLLVSLLCLYLLAKMRKLLADNIFIIMFLLQIIYSLQNIHYTIVFVPFLYASLGGGYCIGIACHEDFIQFWDLYVFFIVNLSGLFILLLFFRHQNLMRGNSSFKLNPRATTTVSFLIIIGINVVPIRYTISNL
ncbi:hypothetical protein PFISCL1PPCAC_14360, partial [Pristionchus fissidentatus]